MGSKMSRGNSRENKRRPRYISTSSTCELQLNMVNGSFCDEFDIGSLAAGTSPYTIPLQNDGLCQNTLENISIAGTLDIVDEDRSDSGKGSKRVSTPSCLPAVMFLVFIMSGVSLIVSLLMFTGKVDSKCTCAYNKASDLAQKSRNNGLGLMQGGSGNTEENWLTRVLANFTIRLDEGLTARKKLEDEVSYLREQELMATRRHQSMEKLNSELHSKIAYLESTTTNMVRPTLIYLNQSQTKLMTKLQMNSTMQDIETRLNKLTKEATIGSKNVDTKMKKIELKLNKTTRYCNDTIIKLRQEFINKTNEDILSENEKIKNILTTLNTTTEKFQKILDDVKEDFDKSKKQTENQVNLTKTMTQSSINALTTTVEQLKTNLNQQLDSKIKVYETKLLNTTKDFNYIVNVLRHELRNATSEDITHKVQSTKTMLMTELNRTAEDLNQVIGDLKKNFDNSNKDLENKMGSAVHVLMTNINETTEEMNVTISILRKEMRELELYTLNKIRNVSKMEGPRGPMGYNGSTGPSGQQGLRGPPGLQGLPGINGSNGQQTSGSSGVNFSQCKYQSQMAKTAANAQTSQRDVTVREPQGKKIVGATCSTNIAKEYNFSKLVSKGNIYYRCTCKGRSTLFKMPSPTKTPLQLKCYIHYWECPIKT